MAPRLRQQAGTVDDREGVDMADRTCALPECDAPHVAKGYCGKHYRAWKAHRDPRTALMCRGDVLERFWFHIDKTDDCWLWTGYLNRDGYARFRIGKQFVAVHRWSYEHFIGPIPDGLTIDHLCRVRNCANPEHLEPVTIGVNTLRGETPPGINARKTHCHLGHQFTPENTYITSKGNRSCRA